MAQLRDIKNRIDSVQKTKKMTQAMKMVAASKFKRASQKVSESSVYLKELETIISTVAGQGDGTSSNPLFATNSGSKNLVILLAGDRGLCGSFNTNILRYAEKTIAGLNGDVDLIVFGKKGYQYFNSKSLNIVDYRERFFETMTIESIQEIVKNIISQYTAGSIGKVILLYNRFISAISNTPVQKQLLPLVMDENSTKSEDVLLEPSIEEVLDAVGEQFLSLTLYKACLESSAAEQGARMAAMDSATTNAGEMIYDLTLLYNRQRQAQITTELSEIVAGAEALVG